MIEIPKTIPEGTLLSTELQLPEKAKSKTELSGQRTIELRTSLKHLPIYGKGMIQVPDGVMASEFYHEEYDLSPPIITHINDFFPEFSELSWEQDIKRFLPSNEMFIDQNPQHLESIHSKRHLARVVVYSRIRAEMLGLNESQKKVIAVAAGYHDTARVNDKWDEEHGKRAADRFLMHINIYESRGLQFTVDEVEAIQVLCHYHEIPWEKIPEEVKTKYTAELEALTDGDKSDRPRSPDRFWWPQNKYMSRSLKEDKLLTSYMDFTKYFTLSNELDRFENDWGFEEAFIKKCIATGIIKKPDRISPGGILIFSAVKAEELVAA